MKGGTIGHGTMFGDHRSLMRQADLFFKSSREIFLVHRLDREVPGLMLLAHSREAAARLPEMFRKNEETQNTEKGIRTVKA